MIGEQYAAGASRPLAARRISLRRRWTGGPAIAGRERLADWLERSVLVQLMLVMAFVALAALLYLAQASQVSVLQFNIADLQAQQVQLNAQNAGLHATAAGLQTMQRIDAAAAGPLHMTKPDLSTAIWVQPLLPRIPAVRPLNADSVSAVQSSQPLAWMRHALQLVQSSL